MSFYKTDQFRTRIDGSRCVYCGEWANSIEHFPPRSFGNRGYILPCCKECNSLAGTEYPTDFKKRAALVNNKLRWKYRRELRIPLWRNEELRPLRYNLRTGTAAWLGMQKIARERTAWDAIASLANTDLTIDFAAQSAPNNITTESERDLSPKPKNSWQWKRISSKSKIKTYAMKRSTKNDKKSH